MFLLCVYHWFSRQEGHHSYQKISMGRQRLTQPAISSPLLKGVSRKPGTNAAPLRKAERKRQTARKTMPIGKAWTHYASEERRGACRLYRFLNWQEGFDFRVGLVGELGSAELVHEYRLG